MKKILFLCVFIFIISGCNKNKLNINVTDTTYINYNDLSIIENDYSEIINIINNINFNAKKASDFNDKITIGTNNTIYHLYITDGYLKVSFNDTNWYSNNKTLITKLKSNLDNLKNKYSNKDFYNISYNKEIDTDNSLLIKLDNNNNYINISSTIPIKNIKIHSTEESNNTFTDVNLLYEYEKIVNNKSILIRTTLSDKKNIRITFENEYNYITSIIPYIENNELKLKTDFWHKESP